MLRVVLAPLSWLYGIVIAVRNRLWDDRKKVTFDIPVVCVGNITVGGTGKTPMCEMLVKHFSEHYRIAVLSRGYKRRTRGYLEVGVGDPYRRVGDEAKQMKTKFPEIVVAVCRDRVEGVNRIRGEHPDVNLVILDDGFQYRRLEPKLNILMVDYTRPIWKDRLLPLGRLRDQRSQMRRAHYVVVTKCPAGMTPLDKRITRNNLDLLPFQNLSFTRIVSGEVFSAFGRGELAVGSKVVAMAGLGNPGPFVEGLRKRFDVCSELLFGDHHPYRVRDLRRMEAALEDAGEDAVIVTTEKDAVRLGRGAKIPEGLRRRIFVQPIEVGFIEETKHDFFKKLDYDVRADRRNSFFYSR